MYTYIYIYILKYISVFTDSFFQCNDVAREKKGKPTKFSVDLRFEHLVGNDGLLTGLWCVSEESVEAW